MNSIINSSIAKSSKLYYQTSIINSTILNDTTIGDFSKIEDSYLNNYIMIDRNNYISNSKIDDYTYTGKNTYIIHSKIGKFNSISWNVSIGGANHDYNRMTQHSFLYNDWSKLKPEGHEFTYNRFKESLVVGNDVWIAAGVVITRGLTIGNGAVIGANTVVTKDVPPYAIVAGNPAKILKYRFDYAIIELMLKLKWWDWDIEKIKKNYHLLSNEPKISELRKLLEQKNYDTI
jgi:virginiamycin A acetyltransferase